MNKVLLAVSLLSAGVAFGQTRTTNSSSTTTSSSNYNNTNTNNYNSQNATSGMNSSTNRPSSMTGTNPSSGMSTSGMNSGTYSTSGTSGSRMSNSGTGTMNSGTYSTSGTSGSYNTNSGMSTGTTPSSSGNTNMMGTGTSATSPSTSGSYNNTNSMGAGTSGTTNTNTMGTGTTGTTSTSTYSTESNTTTTAPVRTKGYKNFAYGLYAGLNNTRFRGESIDANNPAGRLGYQLGFFVRGGGRLYGQVGAEYFASSSDYFRKGDGTNTIQDITDRIDVKYIQVPVYIGYKLTESDRGISAIRVQAGVEYANRIGSNTGRLNLSDSEIKSGSFNALGQLGFDIGPILIDLTYHHGLSNAVQITNFQGSSRRILSASVGFKF